MSPSLPLGLIRFFVSFVSAALIAAVRVATGFQTIRARRRSDAGGPGRRRAALVPTTRRQADLLREVLWRRQLRHVKWHAHMGASAVLRAHHVRHVPVCAWWRRHQRSRHTAGAQHRHLCVCAAVCARVQHIYDCHVRTMFRLCTRQLPRPRAREGGTPLSKHFQVRHTRACVPKQ